MPKNTATRQRVKSSEQVEHKVFPLLKQSVDREKNTFEGYSAGIGNRDGGDDIILPGAFNRTINERVAAGRVKFLDQHRYDSTTRLWGRVNAAKEVEVDPRDSSQAVALEEGASHLLWSRFSVSTVAEAQDALTKIEEGHLDGLSIGFRPIEVSYLADDDEDEDDPLWAWLVGRGVRKLHEVAWWETSSVIWGMNTAALVVPGTVKSLIEFAERAARDGLTVDEDEVRNAMKALGSLLKDDPSDLMEATSTEMFKRMTEKMDTALLQIEKMSKGDDNLDSRGKLVQLYDEFRATAKDVDNPTRAFVSFVETEVEEYEKAQETEGVDTDSDTDGPSLDSLAQQLKTVQDQLGQLAAGQSPHPAPPSEENPGEKADGADEGDPSESESTAEVSDPDTTKNGDREDHDPKETDQAESMNDEKDVLALQLANLNLLEMEI